MGLEGLPDCVEKDIGSKIFYYLIERGADQNVRSRLGHTPLHMACYKGYYGMIKFLLKSGEIDLNTQDAHGRTPLHYLCDCEFAQKGERQHYNMIKLLLEHGADRLIQDNDGLTPFDCLTECGHKHKAKSLLLARKK